MYYTVLWLANKDKQRNRKEKTTPLALFDKKHEMIPGCPNANKVYQYDECLMDDCSGFEGSDQAAGWTHSPVNSTRGSTASLPCHVFSGKLTGPLCLVLSHHCLFVITLFQPVFHFPSFFLNVSQSCLALSGLALHCLPPWPAWRRSVVAW